MEEFLDEVPKHRKKKNKKNKKSNHKHKYDKDVLIKSSMVFGCDIKYFYHHALVCSICNKIGKEKILESEEIKNRKWWRILGQEEILEKYKGLPIGINKDGYFVKSK